MNHKNVGISTLDGSRHAAARTEGSSTEPPLIDQSFWVWKEYKANQITKTKYIFQEQSCKR